VNTNEKRLAEQAQQIADLRNQLESLLSPPELTGSEKGRDITDVTSIVGHTPRRSCFRTRLESTYKQEHRRLVEAGVDAKAASVVIDFYYGHLLWQLKGALVPRGSRPPTPACAVSALEGMYERRKPGQPWRIGR